MLFQSLCNQQHTTEGLSFISINDQQNQINKFRIHSASHVDGNEEDLYWCMYVPVS